MKQQRMMLSFAVLVTVTAVCVSGCAAQVSTGDGGYNGTRPVANAGATPETSGSATLAGNRGDNASKPMPKPKAAVYIMGNPEGRDALRMAVNTFLVKSGRYQMIAVDAIDVVAQEHKRQMGGSVSDAQIAKLGYDAGAQYVCVVERTELDGYSYVATRMVSVESKVAEFADMVELPHGGKIIDIIQWQIGSMLGMAVGPRPTPTAAAPAPATSPAYAAPAQPTPALTAPTQSGTTPTPTQQGGASPSANTPGKYITVKTVKIGGQTWMAENLNIKAGNSWCYEDDEFSCKKYGRLYDWETAKKVCPSGWHLPSRREWNELEDAVGGSLTAGKKLKSTSGWSSGGNGTNDYGFSALPGGGGSSDGGFNGAGYNGYWWTATEGSAYYGTVGAYGRNMDSHDYMDSPNGYKSYGRSVRCVKDD